MRSASTAALLRSAHPIRRPLVEERTQPVLSFRRHAQARDQRRVLLVDAFGRFARHAADAQREALRLVLRERAALAEEVTQRSTASSSWSAATVSCSRPMRAAVAASNTSPLTNRRRAWRTPIAAIT